MSPVPEDIPQAVHVPDDPEPQPVPLHAYFAAEMAPGSRQRAAGGRTLAVERCRFGSDGRHLYRSPWCPHEEPEDEAGPVKPPGWTVQS